MTDRTIRRRLYGLIRAYNRSDQYITDTGERVLSSEYYRAAKLCKEVSWDDARRILWEGKHPLGVPDCVANVILDNNQA